MGQSGPLHRTLLLVLTVAIGPAAAAADQPNQTLITQGNTRRVENNQYQHTTSSYGGLEESKVGESSPNFDLKARRFLNVAMTDQPVEFDTGDDTGKDTDKNELTIKMQPRETNRQLPFRRKDLRRQRKKKLKEQYQTAIQNNTNNELTQSLENVHTEPIGLPDDITENAASLGKLAKVLENTQELVTQGNTDLSNSTSVSNKRLRKLRRFQLKSLNKNRNTKTNSFRPTLATRSTTMENNSFNQNYTTEDPSIPDHVRVSTKAAKSLGKNVNLNTEDEQLVLVEERKLSQGGPRPPGSSGSKTRKTRRRKKRPDLSGQVSTGENKFITNYGIQTIISTPRSELFVSPTPVSYEGTSLSGPSDNPTRTSGRKKRIKQSFDSKKISKESEKNKQYIQNRSHVQSPDNFAMSFQRLYNPRKKYFDSSFPQSDSENLIGNNIILATNTYNPSSLNQRPFPPHNYEHSINPPSIVISPAYVTPSNPTLTSSNYRLPASQGTPIPTGYNKFPLPPNNHGLNINPISPSNTNKIPNLDYFVTTPRGQFGTPPLGTPPPAFFRPADRHVANVVLPLNSQGSVSHGNFPPNQELSSLHARTSTVNISPQKNNINSNLISIPNSRFNSLMTSHIFEPSARHALNPPESYPAHIMPFRRNIFSSRFRNTAVPTLLSPDNRFNSLPSSPVAISQQSRFFPGLASPVPPSSEIVSPSFRSENPRPFAPQPIPQKTQTRFRSGLIKPFIRNHISNNFNEINVHQLDTSQPSSFFSNTMFHNDPHSITDENNENSFRHNIDFQSGTHTISENINSFRENVPERKPVFEKLSTHFRSSFNHSHKPAPRDPSYHFEPPPPIDIDFDFKSKNTLRDGLQDTFSVSLTTARPLASTTPEIFFASTPLPPPNIDYFSQSGESLPVINTFHHLELTELVPPFEPINSLFPEQPNFRSTSLQGNQNDNKFQDKTPHIKVVHFPAPESIEDLRLSFPSRPQLLTTNIGHSLEPSNRFRSTFASPFSLTSSNSIEARPIIEMQPATKGSPPVSEWLESFKTTNSHHNTLNTGQFGVSMFSTPLRPITENKIVPSSIPPPSFLPNRPLSTSSLRIFRSTTSQPNFSEDQENTFQLENPVEFHQPFSPLVSKPIPPLSRRPVGGFQNVVHSSAKEFLATDSKGGVIEQGIIPLTREEQKFRPNSLPSQFRSEINIISNEEDQSIVNNLPEMNSLPIENTINIPSLFDSIQQLAPPTQQLFVTNQSPFLSSPAPSTEFFRNKFRIETLPTLPPSPHVPLFDTGVNEHIFTSNTPSPHVPLIDTGVNEHIFTSKTPMLAAREPVSNVVRESALTNFDQFPSRLRHSNTNLLTPLNDNNSVRDGRQEVILLTSEEDNPPVRIPTSMLDIIDFSRFKGRSFIFMRTNDHEYSVIFPLSDPQRFSTTEPQVFEVLTSSENMPVIFEDSDFVGSVQQF